MPDIPLLINPLILLNELKSIYQKHEIKDKRCKSKIAKIFDNKIMTLAKISL